jgi:hypothetical protein
MMYNSIDPDEARRGRGGKRGGECVRDCLLKTCVRLEHKIQEGLDLCLERRPIVLVQVEDIVYRGARVIFVISAQDSH